MKEEEKTRFDSEPAVNPWMSVHRWSAWVHDHVTLLKWSIYWRHQAHAPFFPTGPVSVWPPTTPSSLRVLREEGSCKTWRNCILRAVPSGLRVHCFSSLQLWMFSSWSFVLEAIALESYVLCNSQKQIHWGAFVLCWLPPDLDTDYSRVCVKMYMFNSCFVNSNFELICAKIDSLTTWCTVCAIKCLVCW